MSEQASRWRGWARAALREPLVHFLIAGAAIFLFYAWRGVPADPASRTITINEEQVSRLAATWAQTWKRAPREQEIDALIREYIKDEVYSREALRLGLDQDDPIIRRRLRSKMEYLARAAAEEAVPDTATLQAWLDAHPARYASDAKISFDQIYLGQGDAATIKARADAALRDPALRGEWRALAAPLSLPASVEGATSAAITRDFGEGFAAELARRPVSGWTGPLMSGFGAHLVRVRAVAAGTRPELATVRQRVENDWRAETARQREERAYQTLLDAYDIRIERP